MPIRPASSSTALSSAKLPTASPGARMKVLESMSISTACTPSLRLPAPYRHMAGKMNGSGRALCWVFTVVPVWISASKRPSAWAPIATRCSVALRPPTTR